MIHSTASLKMIKEELAFAAQCYKVAYTDEHYTDEQYLRHGFLSRIKVLGQIYRMMMKDNNSEIQRMYISMASE